LVEIDGFLVSVKVAVNRSQRELGQSREVRIVGRSNSPELTFGSRVVPQLRGSETKKVAGNVARPGLRIFLNNRLELLAGFGRPFLSRSKTGRIRLGCNSGGT